MHCTFTVYGEVRGQGRPRFDSRNRRTYKAKADRDYEQAIKSAYINQGGHHFGDVPLAMRIDVFRKLPESFPKKVEREKDVHKPDCTNIAKAVEDALNGIAYYDDRQIVEVRVVKHDRTRDNIDSVRVTLVKAE